MKKYSGYIFGISPTIQKLKNEDQAKTWYGQLNEILIEDTTICFRFVWNNEVYIVKLFKHNSLWDGVPKDERGEEWGECSFALYKNEKGILLIGNWKEDGNSSCIVEII